MSQKYVGKQFRVKSHIDLGESYIEEGAVYYYLGETTGVDGTLYRIDTTADKDDSQDGD